APSGRHFWDEAALVMHLSKSSLRNQGIYSASPIYETFRQGSSNFLPEISVGTRKKTTLVLIVNQGLL
ncbi:MAG: hypothetical protein ACYC0Q_11680, partial [Eubacteriales bacterium]